MRRLRGSTRDRGATAVLVALCMVVLVGFTALAVDVGAMWSDAKQLQNGADAGALAVAQSCAAGDCGSYNTMAAQYARDNKVDSNATGTVTNPYVDAQSGTVTVRASTTRSLWFAPILGIDSAPISRDATATWGVKSAGAILPLTFSLCSYYIQTGVTSGAQLTYPTPEVVMTLKSKDDPPADILANPDLVCGTHAAHNEVGGGFGWLVDIDGGCLKSTAVGRWVPSKPGAPPPACFSADSLRDTTVQIPVFDKCRVSATSTAACKNGNNAEYHVFALAAFHVTGYCLANDAKWNVDPCNGDTRQIKGYFVHFDDLDKATTDPTAPNLGLTNVSLTG